MGKMKETGMEEQQKQEMEQRPCNIPPARCGMCGGIVTDDNFNESQGVLIHQSCYENDGDCGGY